MSLIHWWPLNGDTKDYGTNNLSGSLIGSTSFDSAGKIGQCLLADTGGLYSGRGVDIPSNLVSELSDKDYSFCAWVKPNGNHVHYEGAIISSGDWNHSCWAFGLNSNNTAINPAGNWYNTSYVSYTFEVGKWYHIVSVQQDTTNKVYVNGTLIGTVTHGHISQSDASNTCIGRETYAGGYFGFNGCINDVRIYDHALSAKEVHEISKCLVLHYNFEDPYAEGTTNCVPNSSTFSNWSSYGDGYTSVSDCELGGKKIVINNKLAWCGMYTGVSLPEAGTYTISVWCKPLSRTNDSVTQTCYTSGGGISDTNCSVDWSKTGVWQRISMTRTYSTTSLTLYLIAYGGPNDGRISCEYTMPQIEQKDHATPYVNGTRSAGLLYDCSGYGRNGTPVNNPQIVDSNGGSGTKCAKLIDANTYGYFDLGTKTFNFITNGSVCFWAKYTDSSNKMILGANDSGAKYLAANTPDGSSSSGNWYGMVSTSNCYCDGEVYSKPKIDSQWHFYCFTGINFSNWGDLKYFLCIYANSSSNSFQFHGYLADFKIYSTSLSAEDISAEYQRKASIDKNGNLFALYINEYETTNNIGELANYYIETQHAFDGRFGSLKESDYNTYYPNGEPGLGTYEQGNLIVTMTNQGIRIYSEANRDGRAQEGSEWNTWGGFCWSPMKQSRCLIKGHHYRISWHVKGQSSRAMTDVYWSNQIGWGQYPDASPTVHKSVTHPANFQGEMDCFYDFTIEDDVFKTTGSEVHSGFSPNTSYLAYSAFKIGYTYDFTGPLGTDIYITNLQLHDLTTGDTYKIEKNGIVKTIEVVSGRRDSARLHSDGVIDVANIEEC